MVVGNSLGGCVSMRLAERHGRRLAGVVAAAPAGLSMSRLLSLVERDAVLHSILSLPSPVPGVIIRAAVARLYRQLAFRSGSSIDNAIISAFTSHHRSRATVAGYLATAHRMIPELREPFELSRISTPLLLIWGDRDRLAFHQGAQRILDEVPEARLELLRGVGHCPQVEVPERFTELVLGFRADVAAAVS
jgi:pimeloyl-ACP methyl ester carboxylesterase